MAGFFSALIGAVKGGISGFLGTPAAAAAPVRAAVIPSRRVGTVALPDPASVRRTAAAGQRVLRLGEISRRGSLPHPGDVEPVAGVHVHMGGGMGRGNGMVARQTIVQTINLETGALIRQLVFDGAPFLMNSDVRKLRSISRKVSKAHGKLPRRVVKESAMKQLTNAVVDDAIRKVGQPACPPKC